MFCSYLVLTGYFILFGLGLGFTQDFKQDALIGELQKKSTSLVMNLKSVVKTKESPTKTTLFSQRDSTLQNDEEDSSSKAVSQKRKQDSFLVEVQERAEVHNRASSWLKNSIKNPLIFLSSLPSQRNSVESLSAVFTRCFLSGRRDWPKH